MILVLKTLDDVQQFIPGLNELNSKNTDVLIQPRWENNGGKFRLPSVWQNWLILWLR